MTLDGKGIASTLGIIDMHAQYHHAIIDTMTLSTWIHYGTPVVYLMRLT